MTRIKATSKSIPALLVFGVVLMLISSCVSSNPDSEFPKYYPSAEAIVYITLLSNDEFSINNHSSAPIYYQAFPTEILPLIDWAPCESIESCQSIRILPGQSIRLQTDAIRDYHSESLSIFWWHMPADQGQPASVYFSPQHIAFPIP